jgi:uncharacterized protein
MKSDSLLKDNSTLIESDSKWHSRNEILTDQDLEWWYDNSLSHSLKPKFIFECLKFRHTLLKSAFKFFGLSRRGYENALDVQVEHIAAGVLNLPKEFNGFRILFLSDFHIGVMKELPKVIIAKIRNLEVDICLLGGDYRNCIFNPKLPFLTELEKIISCIKAPLGIYGILGNHDGLELISALEKMGIKMIKNESVKIYKENQSINLIGMNWCPGFSRQDFNKAFNEVEKNRFNLFLTHAPDLFREAWERSADLYLCGHTHHGQIQLPLIGPIATFSSAPRKFTHGSWQYKNMVGYTGPGLGAVAAPVRFRCPPKAIVLRLENAKCSH